MIEYREKHCEAVNGSGELIARLQQIPAEETVEDIRKIYQRGISESVMDIYGKYIRR